MTSNTLAEFFAAEGVASEAVHPATAGAPDLRVAVPAGWGPITGLPDDLVYAVWAAAPVPGAQWADNALLSVGRLSAPVDARGALTRALNEAATLPEWVEESASYADYQRFPSARITGTYLFAPHRLWAATRYAFVDVAGVQHLVQFTVTVLRGDEPVPDEVRDLVDRLEIGVPEVVPGA
ncbi:LpqN/LpqT family lipoprotein [Nocardia stercoris]|uniref:Lipoprotein LpqN n=1 Tax=Nocardia stercoris TaxID=2483361 RepID=A0A3M2L0P2_9NOCA|nr:LpqN/LpqT family lipoprotein [Nocardia stercoris]RMI30954.1 hypothetical protein EBN03_20225 [Nocardia stercoris]